MITRAQRHIVLALPFMVMTLLGTGLFVSCSANDGTDTPTPYTEKQEIGFKADVRNMAEGTRATTIDNTYMAENGFICTAYNANSTVVNSTANINATTVTWNDSKWTFARGSRYWPLPSTPGDAYPSLDFFAYMPATLPAYISSWSYSATSSPSVTHNISFSANLSSGASTEYVFALTTGQNKSNAEGGVILNFLHPFARVKFATGTIPSTVTINSVSLAGVKIDGNYSYDGSTSTWSGQSTSGSISGLDDWIIAVPYSNGSKILTVNCTWSDWSNVTKDLTASITANWAAGTSYTYTLNVSKDYALTVNTEKYTEQW